MASISNTAVTRNPLAVIEIFAAGHTDVLENMYIFPNDPRLALAASSRIPSDRYSVSHRPEILVAAANSQIRSLAIAVGVADPWVRVVRRRKEASKRLNKELTEERKAGRDDATVGLDHCPHGSWNRPPFRKDRQLVLNSRIGV